MNTVGWCAAGLVAAVLLTSCEQNMVTGTPGPAPSSGSGSTTVTVTSAAMLPTLRRDEKVTFRPVQAKTYRARPGDIVLVTPPAGWALDEPKQQLILRVIAVDGQTVQCCDARNRVVIDGAPLDEPYLARLAGDSQLSFAPVTVPANRLWLMGDNRADSVDSRAYLSAPGQGTVPAENAIGVLDPPR